MRPIILILSFIISFIPLSSFAAVYKWTDSAGNVHYSQKKPTNAKVERIKIAPPPEASTSSYKKPSLDKKDATSGKNDGQAANDKNKKKAAKKNDSGCKTAKANLQTLQTSPRVKQKDKDGNVAYMNDEQKKQQIKQEKEYIAKNCK